jgi:ubiquinone/menaquinone biosynthesis C-methylase UbiE
MNHDQGSPSSGVLERLDVATCCDLFQVHLHEQRYARVLEEVDAGDHLLEIGTGLGVFSGRIAPKVKCYRGVEYDVGACEQAKTRVADPNWISLGDAQALDLQAESFDVVVCLEVLEHLPDFRKALDEIVRVLRPNGRLIASIPYARVGGPSLTNPHHLYEPGEEEFSSELKKRFGKVQTLYQRYAETPFETVVRRLRLRRVLGLAEQYARLSLGDPKEMGRILLDEQRAGLLQGLFVIASLPIKRCSV